MSVGVGFTAASSAYSSLFSAGGVLSHVGRQDFHDPAVVFLGIFDNPFQGIDPAQPDCHFAISQLRDCFGKPVGDVALFRHPDIVLSYPNSTLGQIQPIQEPQAAQNLGEGSAVLIFKFCELVLIVQ